MSSTPISSDIATLQAIVTAQQERLAARDAEIEHLKLVITKLRRMHFGQRSEQLDETAGQLELALEELEAVRAERTEAQAPAAEAEPVKRASRKPLPDHLESPRVS